MLKDFWGVEFEALYRCFHSDIDWILNAAAFAIEVSKALKRLKLKHLMFLEFFRLREMITQDKHDLSRVSALLSDVDEKCSFANRYGQLSKLELRSLGKKKKSNDVSSFLQNQLLPVAVRSIPGAFLSKISEMAFDFELFPNDIQKLQCCEVNEGIPKEWWQKNPLKAWSDSVMKNRISQVSDDICPKSNSEAVSVVYEAPWVMPSIARNDTKKDSKRQSIPIPARTLKMEGRRQSYKPNENESLDEGALCVIGDQSEDGFTINRGILNTLRNWTQDDSNDTPMMINDQPIGDVLQDLLHSPPQPSTRVASPVKIARTTSDYELSSPQAAKRMRMDANILDNNENIAPTNGAASESISHTPAEYKADSAGSTTVPSVDPQEAKNKFKRSPKRIIDEAPSTGRRRWRESKGEDEYFQFNAF